MGFKRFKKILLHFFLDIGMSGRYRGKKGFGISDYLVRYVLLNCVVIFGGIILGVFAVSNFRMERYFTSAVCAGMFLLCLIFFVVARTKIRQFVPAFVLVVSYGLLCVMLTWTGESEGANFLFIYIYPLVAIMLVGKRFGVALSVILITLISLEMFIPGVLRNNLTYSLEFSIRMLINYILVFFVMIVIESTRNIKDRLIENQNRRLEELKKEADVANRTKSNFLASMSHEIRTPMNAISGMAELLLRRELPEEAKGEVQDIKQASSNLISIINDILDLSKIEAGKMEIIPVKYIFASLINDTVNIIRMRLTEKPIRFYTNIDGNIPNSLIGDEIRLRQILLNLLSNAAKYTDKGHISLSITVQEREKDRVRLEITVTDSGKGMKLEDVEKLFGDFVQVDTKKNRGIEGTGLGLAITKKLCEAMGGDISVQSEYGKGSAFTVHIPQDINSTDFFATVEDAARKKVLIYEHRTVYAKSVCWSLQNMGVPHTLALTPKDFTEALLREEWYYVFSSYGLYEEIKRLTEQAVFANGKKPSLALMVEWENEANIPNVRFISLPVQSLSIANVLNGKADTRDYFNARNSALIRFTYPSARLLIVDDISTNLKVAEGLLAPYRAKIDTSLNGARAIELVKQHNYDIVFMDHMMPEMDGIEATAAIRAWEALQMSNEKLEMSNERGVGRSAVPIIALTANAVSGMREMFIEKGFNDFLAKPIDISKLDEMLGRWIPKEKREKGKEKNEINNEQLTMNNERNPDPSSHCSLLTAHCSLIPGVDIEKGISMTGGTMELYRQVIALFRKDAEERLPVLHNVLQHDVPDAGALTAFVTQVHALKSASASVGAAEISAKAAELESAGKAGDMVFIRENLAAFAEDLVKLVEGIRAWENAGKKEAPKGEVAPAGMPSPSNNAEVMRLLQELSSALEAKNAGDIDRILEELNGQVTDAKTKEALDAISDNVLMTEYESAVEIIRSLLNE